jgi:hypothetical protein
MLSPVPHPHGSSISHTLCPVPHFYGPSISVKLCSVQYLISTDPAFPSHYSQSSSSSPRGQHFPYIIASPVPHLQGPCIFLMVCPVQCLISTDPAFPLYYAQCSASSPRIRHFPYIMPSPVPHLHGSSISLTLCPVQPPFFPHYLVCKCLTYNCPSLVIPSVSTSGHVLPSDSDSFYGALKEGKVEH